MSLHSLLVKSASVTVAVAIALLTWASPTQARITRIIIDKTAALTGQDIPYETIAGRAFGELDPHDRHDSIITDILSGTDPDGKVRYVTSFFLVKPVDMAQASGFMWHDVPNRGGLITIVPAERNLGDVGLSSGWQGDNASAPNALATRVPDYATSLSAQTNNPNLANNEWVKVPVAKNRDGSSITGNILGRIVNRSGSSSQPLNVMGNPIPYLPATLDTRQATLVTHTHETVNGSVDVGPTIPSTDCPGNNWGSGIFRANPVPEAQLVNVLRLAMRNWIMNGTPPPPSRWPTLAAGTLVDPTPQAMGFPSGIPGIPPSGIPGTRRRFSTRPTLCSRCSTTTGVRSSTTSMRPAFRRGSRRGSST